MDNFKRVMGLSARLVEEEKAYVSRPTKASRQRLRNLMSQIKGLVTEAKRDLIKLDKEGK